eukprot:6152722-Pleurochrysis_carterae.AAC.1
MPRTMAKGSASLSAEVPIGSDLTKRSLPRARRCRLARAMAERPCEADEETRELWVLAVELNLARVDVVHGAVHLDGARQNALLDGVRELNDALHRVEDVDLSGELNLLLKGAVWHLLDGLLRSVDDVVEHLADGAADRSGVATRQHGLHGGGDGAALGVAGDHDELAVERADGVFSRAEGGARRGH